MKFAIMQPYIFPYLGYFQLIKSVDVFVFYDDVNFIKQGWVNRNKILVNGKENLFTIPIKNASSFTLIQNTEINQSIFLKWQKKFLRTVEQEYRKAPYFEAVFPLVERVLKSDNNTIAEMAESCVKEVSNFLNLNTKFYTSSKVFNDFKVMDRADRIIAIGKRLEAKEYINPAGGKQLYQKNYFKKEGISLYFIKNIFSDYAQFNKSFIPGLSIIDVLMFNSIPQVNEMLGQYEIE